jgi:hydroxymethylbilane synthase
MFQAAALRLGTRSSRLATAQSRIAAGAMAAAGIVERPDQVQLIRLRTRGDEISDRHPAGRWELSDGQFTTELERALLDRDVDLVVHSFKDLPTASTPGLAIAAVLERGDARDCLLTRDGGGLDGLPYGASVATSSTRRAAQLKALRPDLVIRPIRGNVDSRLRRLASSEFDALLVAAAGLDRLEVPVADTDRLSFDQMLPAPAQGALAVQVRSSDVELGERLAALDHAPTHIAVEAERALLGRVGGGCMAPLGALGEVTDGNLRLRAAYEGQSGALVRVDVGGSADASDEVVADAAHRILAAVRATAS